MHLEQYGLKFISVEMTFCIILFEMQDSPVPKFLLEPPKELPRPDVIDITEPIDVVLELAKVAQIFEECLRDSEVSAQGGSISRAEVVAFQDHPEATEDPKELEKATMEEVVLLGLPFVITDESEYLFLVDIQSMTEFREDEALSTL